MATSGRHMARFSARNCAIGPVRTVPIHPSSQKRAASRGSADGRASIALVLAYAREDYAGDIQHSAQHK